MPDLVPPFILNFDLARLPETGKEIMLAPGANECAAIARWADVTGIDAFKAKVLLKKLGEGYVGYEAEFAADIVQSCVVTLEPVRSHIAREFHRTFHVPEKRHKQAAKRLDKLISKITLEEEEPPEELPATVLDVAAPVLEELNLAIDPFPRKPGAAFEPPADKDVPTENPFAVLKELKGKG